MKLSLWRARAKSDGPLHIVV